jgi:radical SAM protein with 4Fe4S-binding SPASM domain
VTELEQLSNFNSRPLPGQTRNCLDPWFNPAILVNGEIWPCCWFYQKPLGNVHVTPFDQVINGPAFQELRRELLTGNLRKVCVECPSRSLTTPKVLLERLRARLSVAESHDTRGAP